MLSYYCNAKDKVPENLKSLIVYEYCCPVSNNIYIGKKQIKVLASVLKSIVAQMKSHRFTITCSNKNILIMW